MTELVWKQRAGQMWRDGALYAAGLAGHGDGKNNPDMQNVKGVGPLPQGWYTMTGIKSGGPTGPDTIILVPDALNTMFGRGDFRIHGLKIGDPEHSSDGCICFSPGALRRAIYAPGQRVQVVA